MKALDLVLTTKWFQAWQQDKREDYRELTNYWIGRLFGKNAKLTDSKGNLLSNNQVYDFIASNPSGFLKNNPPKNFTHIKLNLGYQKDRPTNSVEFGGIEIRRGKKKWGAGDKIYFCIIEKEYFEHLHSKQDRTLTCINSPIVRGEKVFNLTVGKDYHFTWSEDPPGWQVEDDNGKTETFFNTSQIFE